MRNVKRRVSLVPTTRARHDGCTCDAGIIQRRSYGPVDREPDETKDRSQLQRFVRSQRWGVPRGRRHPIKRRVSGIGLEYADDKRRTSTVPF